ncbi:hypothetical protein SAMN04488033_1412 [Salegentibacter agarivorans]|uniref:Uncharacterized protein n=1 Tax=Salegentibacter agarivorans TaxID=345907 RepID=A0A1I2Q1S7_9FLAO|nr:hypothetical protein [Salegentibacter agarivorans]SFG21888.1 hypothetical protein SAMN04488033_13921 [Salegentibacter agarivorans]SFG22455.1 hypothetical protein SAMN04488033_1412 [Salegentibacter agarivorans]
MHSAYTTGPSPINLLGLKAERNWNYYELITKTKYKADLAGIELIVD